MPFGYDIVWRGHTKGSVTTQSFVYNSDCFISIIATLLWFNALRPWQNGRHLPDYFQKHFLEWKCINFDYVFTEVPMGPINNNPALVPIMAWRRPGDKPLSEPMMATLQTHICVTRPQWVNISVLLYNLHMICYTSFCKSKQGSMVCTSASAMDIL